jgi:rhamnosyl/mannosyltransferase
LKVLQVYKDYYPPVRGGIESHINLLANGLIAKGVDVQVLVSNTSNKFQMDNHYNIKIAKAPQWGRFYSAPLTPTFFYYLRKFGKDADIIHFHHPNPTAEISFFLAALKKKMIVTYHSDIIRQDKLGKLYSPFRTIFLRASDRIIATSPNYIMTSDVLQHYKHKCSVIPLGIDVERFQADNGQQKIKKIKSENGNVPIVLFVGRFRYYKGLEFLIAAMKNVDAKLLLIGTGPEEEKIRLLIDSMQLNKKVQILGELDDDQVTAYYKACDIFVLPSHLRSEAFGMVLLEAMSCSKPIISTEIGTGTSYVNINQRTGLTVRPEDIESLSHSINYILDHHGKKMAFGDSGLQRVKQLFSANRMIEKTYQLYQEIIFSGK